MAAVSAVRARSFRPSRSQSKPAWEVRANGLSRLQPNRSSGPQPSASARAAQPSSMNRPQSSMNRNHRVGGTSQGGWAGSSRASASAQARGAPPSYWMVAARSSYAFCEFFGRPSNGRRPQQRHEFGLVTTQEIDHDWRRRRRRLQHQILALNSKLDAGSPRSLQGFSSIQSVHIRSVNQEAIPAEQKLVRVPRICLLMPCKSLDLLLRRRLLHAQRA